MRPFFVKREAAARISGERGEMRVGHYLDDLNPANYLILNDVMLGGSGKTTQIDHLVVSTQGLFVIETKNYDGWIYGNESDEEWTQVLFKRKHRFYNPLRQNASHIRALKYLLSGMGQIPFHSVIVFTGESTLKVNENLYNVVKGRDLCHHIQDRGVECLSLKTRDEIYQRICSANITDEKTKRDHVDYAFRRRREVEDADITGICPRCGGRLVQKNGRFGPFKGCTNYENGCRFTITQKARNR